MGEIDRDAVDSVLQKSGYLFMHIEQANSLHKL